MRFCIYIYIYVFSFMTIDKEPLICFILMCPAPLAAAFGNHKCEVYGIWTRHGAQVGFGWSNSRTGIFVVDGGSSRENIFLSPRYGSPPLFTEPFQLSRYSHIGYMHLVFVHALCEVHWLTGSEVSLSYASVPSSPFHHFAFHAPVLLISVLPFTRIPGRHSHTPW